MRHMGESRLRLDESDRSLAILACPRIGLRRLELMLTDKLYFGESMNALSYL